MLSHLQMLFPMCTLLFLAERGGKIQQIQLIRRIQTITDTFEVFAFHSKNNNNNNNNNNYNSNNNNNAPLTE